jgi:hypothetical protein
MVRQVLLRDAAAIVAALLVTVAALTSACARGPLVFEALQTGKTLNSDNSVGVQGMRFTPTETMYASVLTAGAGKGRIRVLWKFRGSVVNEGTKDVSYQNSAATEFHLQYAGRLPVGEYTVEILIDGREVATRTLKVEDGDKVRLR